MQSKIEEIPKLMINFDEVTGENKQEYNPCSVSHKKEEVGNILRTSRPSLNTRIMSRMSTKSLNNKIQKRKKKLFQCLMI